MNNYKIKWTSTTEYKTLPNNGWTEFYSMRSDIRETFRPHLLNTHPITTNDINAAYQMTEHLSAHWGGNYIFEVQEY